MSVTPIERAAAAPLDTQVNAFESPVSDAEYWRYARVRGEMRWPRVHGKFLFVAEEKFWIRGVTYGTFEPDAGGVQFAPHDVVERDFRAIAELS